MSKNNYLFPIIAFLILNIALLLFPQDRSVATVLTVMCLLYAVLILKHQVIILLPLLVYTPIQSIVNLPLMSVTLLFGGGWYLLKLKKIKLDYTFYTFIFLLFWAGLTSFWSEQPLLAIKYLTFYFIAFLMVIVFILLKKDEETASRMLIVFLISSSFAFAFKLIFQLDSTNLTTYFLSLGGNDLWLDRLTFYSDGEFQKRLLFFGQEPNYTAFSSVMGVFVSLSIWRSKKAYFLKIPRTALTFLIALNYIQAIGTYSRTGFAIATLLILLFSIKSIKSLLFSIFSLIVSFSYVAFVFPSLILRVLSISDSKGASGRTELWSKAIDFWAESPIFGIGFSNYYARVGDAAHNTFLQILAEQGIIGGLLFTGFMCSHLLINNKIPSLKIIYVGGIGLFSCALFISFLSFQDVKILTFYFGIIALLVNFSDKHKKDL